MPRVPDHVLDRIKTDVRLAELVAAEGVKLSRHGASDLVGRCPFHEDDTPSLVITPDKNLWHCMGACQTGGSPIDWVMKARNLSFRDAVDELARQVPSLAANSSRPAPPAPKPLAHPEAADQELLRRVVGYYHATLKSSPEALDYLAERGLRHPELIETFQLGYANRTLCQRLPRTKKVGQELRSRLQSLGVLRDSGHEHLNGSLVVPIIDGQGRVTEMYGRKIGKKLRKGTPQHLYLPGPHRGVWNVQALHAAEDVILCESLIDAMTFWCAGFRNVTASYGTSGFTPDHLETFKAHGIRRVFIAYDRDQAGDVAAAKLAKRLIAEGFDCLRVQFPKGMDVSDYARQMKPADAALRIALDKALWLGGGQRPEPQPKTAPPPKKAGPTKVSAPLAAQLEVGEQGVTCQLGDRVYRVRGLDKNTSFDTLRINLLARRRQAFFVDNLDLYAAKARGHFIKAAASELGAPPETLKADLGRLLLALEALQAERIQAAMEPTSKPIVLTPEEEREALELLRDPDLARRILEDFERAGVTGEETNKLAAYLACTSRLLDQPIAVVIQSASAAGKSSLMEAVLAFIPDEDRIKYSAMTGQSLFYMGETNLQHRILAIVEEEGAEKASYALKLLQSEGELTIASTGKDPQSGRHVTHEYRVEGPVMIMLTTTAVDIDEELLNRCIVLSVDDGRGQTRAIHDLQRQAQTIEGLLAKEDRKRVIRLHQNAQRLLRPLAVANPFAPELTFVSHQTRTRRDHMKYLTLIRAIALLHQHQRPIRTARHHGQSLDYIEVTLDDIALANRLAHQILGRALDELPPQTRKLLGLVHEMVTKAAERLECEPSELRFTRRDVREHTGWGHTQLKIHLKRLEELEYLLVHKGGRGAQFVYELLFDGGGRDLEGPRLQGLLDVDKLRAKYDDNRSGSPDNRSGAKAAKSHPGRVEVGARPAAGRPDLPGLTPASLADAEPMDSSTNGKRTSHLGMDMPVVVGA